MRIKHSFGFNAKRTNLINFLDDNNIRYKRDQILITFDIYENNTLFTEVKKIMNNNNLTSFSEIIFTTNEILAARWLSVRSKWRWEYPQPEDDYMSITYNDSDFCDKCGRGLKQQDSFYLKKEPKWGSRQFVQPFWVEDELFVRNKTAEELKDIGLRGLSFLPVKQYKTKKELLTIKQMNIDTILDEKLLFDEGDINETIICPKCGKTKYILFGHTILKAKEESLKKYSVDILKTKDIFGAGLMAARVILISYKFARIILEKKWKNLVLEPVKLV